MRWFTSDLHFGHENIIRYCKRPFRDVDDMDESLIVRWNDRVDRDDEVWVLGDLAMGLITESLKLIQRLAGHKVLLTGNHDRCWPGNPRSPEEWNKRYRAAGIDEIFHGSVNAELSGRPVQLCHFPYEGDSHDEDRFTQYRPIDDGRWLLHGHVHTKWQVHDRQINVGVDAWDYAPVGEPELAAIVAAGPQASDRLPAASR